MDRFEFESFDGKKISCAEWKTEDPKGVLQISHGMAEHILRYGLLAEFMTKNGYIVVGDDHRAHGETDKDTPGYADGDIFSETVRDMAALSKIYKEKYPELPIILFGHSYGSFLTQSYIEKNPQFISGAIIGGSAYMKDAVVPFCRFLSLFGNRNKPAKLLNTMSIGAYNKKFTDGSFISSIPAECERYNDDKKCGFACSKNFYHYFFKGLMSLYKQSNYKNIDTEKPVLLLAGALDPVGNNLKSMNKLYDFYKNTVGIKTVEKIYYENVRHEYLNDTSREKAFNDILDFCDGICK